VAIHPSGERPLDGISKERKRPRHGSSAQVVFYDLSRGVSCPGRVSVRLSRDKTAYRQVMKSRSFKLYDSRLKGKYSNNHQTPVNDSFTSPNCFHFHSTFESFINKPAEIASYDIQSNGAPLRFKSGFRTFPPPLLASTLGRIEGVVRELTYQNVFP
jgi:hypothetical protein